MEKKYTFLERFKSDTPVFFKRAQVLGGGLVALAGGLAGVPLIPGAWLASLAGFGTALVAISQFVVKQIEPDHSAGNNG